MKEDNKKTPKKPPKYVCETCDFISSNKKDYMRHLSTRKHKKTPFASKKTPNVEYFCNVCKKRYKYASGLSRHNKKVHTNRSTFVEKKIKEDNTYPPEYSEQKLSKEKTWKELIMTQLEHQNETIALLRESISTNSKMRNS